MYADELLLPWFGGLMERLPGVRLVDAHTHLGGNDPDGWRCTPSERFDLRHPGVASVFAAAAEHRLPVIIHAGPGIPSLGCDALRLAERYPRDAQIQAVTGGQLQRLLAGDDPADLGPAPGPAPPRPPLLDRVFTLLVGALARMLDGLPATGLLQLARLGCQADPQAPEAPLLGQITELLDRHQRYAQTAQLDGRRAAGFHLILTAATLAATPGVP